MKVALMRLKSCTSLIAGVASILLLLACGGGMGCMPMSSRPAGGSTTVTTSAISAQLRQMAMAAADGYCNETVQVLDNLTMQSKDPELTLWAQSQIVSIGYSAITNATGPSDGGALLDMMVYSTLKRCAVEEHWVPDLLHEQG